MNKVRVKILQAGLPTYWYNNKIGKEFDCMETENDFEVCFNNPCKTFCIDKNDAQIIKRYE